MPHHIRVRLLMLGSALGVAALDSEARMYQWTGAGSGRVQLSGAPPAWYRTTEQGPRVLVFDNGVLIDDTAIAVPEAHREALHAAAFGGDATTIVARPADVNESAPTAQARDGLRASANADIDADPPGATVDDAQPAAARGSVEATVAELKSLLEAWDNRRLDEAQELLRESNAATR